MLRIGRAMFGGWRSCHPSDAIKNRDNFSQGEVSKEQERVTRAIKSKISLQIEQSGQKAKEGGQELKEKQVQQQPNSNTDKLTVALLGLSIGTAMTISHFVND